MNWLQRAFHTCKLPRTPDYYADEPTQTAAECEKCGKRWLLLWAPEIIDLHGMGADIGEWEWVAA